MTLSRPAARWRAQAGLLVSALWPEFPGGLEAGVDWVEAQVWQESCGDPDAKSPAGALGLLQLMPWTARELGVTDPLDPAQSIRGGITYLKRQFDQLGEVPDPEQRLLWALACYNGGRGYVDVSNEAKSTALTLARQRAAGVGFEEWWRWDFGKLDLARVRFRGKAPDWAQMVGYVDGIRRKFDLVRAGS